MLFFSHDTDASTRDLIDLRCECGGAAVDAYWYILEQIYRQETYWVYSLNQSVKKSVLRVLDVDETTFLTWVNVMVDLGLFFHIADSNGEPVGLMSVRAKETIEAYQQKAAIARENGKKGGRPKKAKNQTKTEGVSNRKPNPNQEESGSKAKKRKEKKRDRFTSVNRKPISSSDSNSVENSPRCPECGQRMRFDYALDGWRCCDGDCRATLKAREVGER